MEISDENFFILLNIAGSTGLAKKLVTSTSKLGSIFSYSQQSISRKLRELENAGLILREVTASGTELQLTPSGIEQLRQVQKELNNIFPATSQIKQFSGIVQSGLGEGAFYLGFSQYTDPIKGKFGFVPFKGTLNLKINRAELDKHLFASAPIKIAGFSTKERNFGGLIAYPILINNSIKGALVFPDRSNLPKEIAELIAPVKLREKFKLKDNDTIKFSLV